jgi:diguanylate cyclase (GGDEF)-like protein
MITIPYEPTRFSDVEVDRPVGNQAAALFVRIYPASSIERPTELGEQSWLVGRDTACAIQLDDDSVSRRHATIDFDGESHIVRDLGSTNGTFVNEQRLNTPYPLTAGDRVRFGNQIFKYLAADALESQYHECVFRIATTDGLTGAYNKRYLLDALDRELARLERDAAPVTVMLLDLDKFKSVNDMHGHLAGDAVLVEFVRRVETELHGGEILARYGGEEFAVFAPRTSVVAASAVAERIRAQVAASPFVFESQSIHVTTSIGVADTTCAVTTAGDLLAAADARLYRAKNFGRNQVCWDD